MLENEGYAVGYSEVRKDPLWATYKCGSVDNATSPGARPSRFKTDKRTQAQVTHDDFSQSDYNTNPMSYDRGHMAPNFAIGSRYGRQAQLGTFIMSNVCPQRSTLNQQTWEAMEKCIANELSFECEAVWVTVGPIFPSSPMMLNGVAAIPAGFFAICVDNDSGFLRILATAFDQADRGSGHTLREHWTTVDDIEAKTGLDFFSDLPDALETSAEKTAPDEDWQLDRLLIPTPHH